jgi:hypothetical protein
LRERRHAVRGIYHRSSVSDAAFWMPVYASPPYAM